MSARVGGVDALSITDNSDRVGPYVNISET